MNPNAVGVGLRTAHYQELLAHGLPLGFAEVISENFMARGGRPREVLERVRQDTALALHGVGLSLGSVDPLDRDYLRELVKLRREIEAVWISDHLCFSSVGGHHAHDLWPIPFSEEALVHVSERVLQVQEILGAPLLVENVSSYIAYGSSTMSEWEFLGELCARTECQLLLDLNNVVVNAHNHGFDAEAFIAGLPLGRVRQLHLAGHTQARGYRLDDHAGPVHHETWALYRSLLSRAGRIPVIIEWDSALPALVELCAEAERADFIAQEVLRESTTGTA